MHSQRLSSLIVIQVLLVCSSWLVAPATASGQSVAEIEAHAQKIARRNACTDNIGTRTFAMQHDQPELLVSSAREFIANCLGWGLYLGHENEQEAYALADIAFGLDEQGKFEDSIPVSTRCVTVKPDAAFCFVEIGRALEGLGRLSGARKAYEQTISIGGYDNLNAGAVKFAKARLANIPPEDEAPQPVISKESEPPTTTETKKFGTGFMVSTQGHILTNNHVVAGCKTLATRDGKPLEILNRNVESDLALLLQPNWSYDKQKLVDILRSSRITDDDRDAIWNAYHTNISKADFISTLNKFDMTDDVKRAIYDLRFKKSHYESKDTPVGVFRTGPAPKLGDAVVAFGFPLPGVLSSEGNVSTGIVSATSGLGNDVRFIQISAPVQPGNSGGPLFDSSGHVIGVVVAKLDAVRIAELTGDIPQNVNFAVHWSEVRAFLDEAGVPYQKEVSQRGATTRAIAAAASRISVAIECNP